MDSLGGSIGVLSLNLPGSRILVILLFHVIHGNAIHNGMRRCFLASWQGMVWSSSLMQRTSCVFGLFAFLKNDNS
jgi:hypothetical protein